MRSLLPTHPLERLYFLKVLAEELQRHNNKIFTDLLDSLDWVSSSAQQLISSVTVIGAMFACRFVCR